MLEGLEFYSALGQSFTVREDLLKPYKDYNTVRLVLWVFDCEQGGWTKGGSTKEKSQNELEGTEVAGGLLEPTPCISCLFLSGIFPIFILFSTVIIYQFFTLELSFTIKPQFQLLFLLVICASPTPNSLLRSICICFSTSGTTSLFMHQRDAGEVFPRKHPGFSPLHMAPLQAHRSLLSWTTSCDESSFNHYLSDHRTFKNPTSYSTLLWFR